jgi:hypothetical protein
MPRTVTEDELGDTSNIHSNATEEVVVATQSYQTCRSNGALKAAENEYGGGVWDEEADEAEQCWIGYKELGPIC